MIPSKTKLTRKVEVSRWCSWCEGGTKLHETFVMHQMTRNNTLNKVHVAATELPQLLMSQNTNMFREATAQSRWQTLCSSIKLTEKNYIVGNWGDVPQHPLAGDANDMRTFLTGLHAQHVRRMINSADLHSWPTVQPYSGRQLSSLALTNSVTAARHHRH